MAINVDVGVVSLTLSTKKAIAGVHYGTITSSSGTVWAGSWGFSISSIPASVVVQGGATLYPYVYVADTGNNQIDVFNYSGGYLFSFGTTGTGDGNLLSPYGVCTNGDFVWVTDTGNNRVQKFDMEGNYVSQFGSTGTGDSQFEAPMGICVDYRFLYVVDNINNRLHIVNPLDHSQYMILYGDLSGNDFVSPTDITQDADYLYITDSGGTRELIIPKVWLTVGTYADVQLPVFEVTATGVRLTATGNIEISMPFLLDASGTSGEVGSADISLPIVVLADGEGSGTAPGSATVILPVLDVTAVGIWGDVGSGAIELPALEIGYTSFESGPGSAGISLPALYITANGRVTLATSNYNTIVTNTRTRAISEYTNFSFNSYAYFNGQYYAAGDGGIVTLGGNLDGTANIDAEFTTGIRDFFSAGEKRYCREAWVNVRGNRNLQLTLTEDEVSTYNHVVTVSPNTSTVTDSRVKFPRGLKGRFYKLKIQNVNGGDFEVDVIRVKGEPISEHTR